ncbi:MAG: HgcAB-associated protein [Thermoplasmata archaeon]|nr:HgcAB-associated protein [Thermoplasmata archaeon]
MTAKSKKSACCPTKPADYECYKIESIVKLDDKGQLLLPKDLREKAGIGAGEKLAVVCKEKEGKVCCLYLFKADELSDPLHKIIGSISE